MAKGKLAVAAALAGSVAAFEAYKRAQAPEPLKTHYFTSTPQRRS